MLKLIAKQALLTGESFLFDYSPADNELNIAGFIVSSSCLVSLGNNETSENYFRNVKIGLNVSPDDRFIPLNTTVKKGQTLSGKVVADFSTPPTSRDCYVYILINE